MEVQIARMIEKKTSCVYCSLKYVLDFFSVSYINLEEFIVRDKDGFDFNLNLINRVIDGTKIMCEFFNPYLDNLIDIDLIFRENSENLVSLLANDYGVLIGAKDKMKHISILGEYISLKNELSLINPISKSKSLFSLKLIYKSIFPEDNRYGFYIFKRESNF
ncbi:MAG: hypothetical protein QXJ28_01610 [Candidatus Pacearchaeota archaeon]